MSEQTIKDKVISVIKGVKTPGVSTSEVARKAGVAWETAGKYLHELKNEKKVNSGEVGGTTTWWWVGGN